ncbi:MAG: hypothetical protein AB7T49_11435 [Oligoflexales bacterium]
MHLATALILSSFFLSGCKPRDSDSTTKDTQAHLCELRLKPGQAPSDIIAKAAEAGCNTDPETMLGAMNCKHGGRTIIAENDRSQSPRTIDMFECGSKDEQVMDNLVFFSHPNEMLTGDSNSGALNFYKYEESGLVFKGNSFAPDNECRRCHVTGGMVMKELILPWRNWLVNAFSAATPEDQAWVGVGPDGNPRTVLTGAAMEQFVHMANVGVAIEYKKALRQQIPELQTETLKDVTKGIFCTPEINLNTKMDEAPANNSQIPVPFDSFGGLLSSLFFDFRSDSLVTSKAPGESEFTEYLTSNNIKPNKIVAIPTVGDGIASKNRFLARSEDEGQLGPPSIQKEFVSSGLPLVEKELLLAAKFTDFPNPIFSKKRCSIWKHIPEKPMRGLDTPAKVTGAIESSLAVVNEPGTQEFLANLKAAHQDISDFKAQVNAKQKQFVEKCKDSSSAFRNVDQVYRLLRAKTIPLLQKENLRYFEKVAVVEHFPNTENSPSKVFPEYQEIIDGKYAADEGLGLDEFCKLTL